MTPRDNRPDRQPRQYVFGCALSGTGFLLLWLIIILIVVLARREDMRGSALWLMLIPLVLALAFLYGRARRF